jgi:hypothetical protein
MNFLELVTDAARETGVPGSIVNVASVSGEAARLVNWVLRAYRKIQGLHQTWLFMRRDFTYAAAAGVANLTASAMGVTTFGKWREGSFRVYRTSTGTADEQPLTPLAWDAMRDGYLFGAARDQVGRPQYIAVKPDQSLQLWPTPDDAYTLVGEHYMAPQSMSANGDLPVIPAAFHDAIVWRAVMFYAGYESDPSLYASAQREFQEVLAALEADQLPEWVVAGSFV